MEYIYILNTEENSSCHIYFYFFVDRELLCQCNGTRLLPSPVWSPRQPKFLPPGVSTAAENIIYINIYINIQYLHQY